MSRERQLLMHVYQAMVRRCANPADKAYADYGGRGIAVCDRWLESFGNFFADMAPRPTGTLLDRRENDGPYSPDNCRWATRKEQNSNRRNCIYVDYAGERLTLKEASRRAGLTYRAVHKRVVARGWPVDLALSVPIGQPWGTGRRGA